MSSRTGTAILILHISGQRAHIRERSRPVVSDDSEKRLKPARSALYVRVEEDQDLSLGLRTGQIMNSLISMQLCQFDESPQKHSTKERGDCS